MLDTISYNEFLDYSPDDRIWVPIPAEEYELFDTLIARTEQSFDSGSNKEKGDSLESLMTYVYNRFKIKRVFFNERTRDNQIDHILEFIDGMVPTWIHENIGLRLIGESKNHDKSISSREVNNLDELLRAKKSKLGIFSSFKSFSKGHSMWTNGEGKRRKLALWNRYERIIIGFTLKELASLKENNFYSLLKQKYYQIVDELEDDNSVAENISYHDSLYYSLNQMYRLGIIEHDSMVEGIKRIEEKYGALS